MKFRKKPVVIDAVKFDPENNPWPEGVKGPLTWTEIGAAMDCNQKKCDKCGHELVKHGMIESLEGRFKVCPGDMVITGVKGEKYACKPDIFEMTYEKVEDDDYTVDVEGNHYPWPHCAFCLQPLPKSRCRMCQSPIPRPKCPQCLDTGRELKGGPIDYVGVQCDCGAEPKAPLGPLPPPPWKK